MKERMIKNNEEYDIGTFIKSSGFSGKIIDKRILNVPLNNDVILYCVLKDDNHVEWVNSRYCRKV